jgi:glycosyltransferase involved in cell wall biosynthesis
MKTDISFVVPVHNEEGTLRDLEGQIRESVPAGRRFEILFIDDGSTDGSPGILDELAGSRPGMKVIHFESNYGKGAALACGFQEAVGDAVFTIDADLQDDPVEIPRFVEALEARGLDMVCGWRKIRRDSTIKRLSSRAFNTVVHWVSRMPLHDFNCGYKCYRKRVVKEIPMYGGMHRFTPILARSRGFRRIGEIPVTHNPRRSGKTKYGLERLFTASMDLVTVLFLERFVRRPMRFFGWLGLSFLFAGVLVFVWEMVAWLRGGDYNVHVAVVAALVSVAVTAQCIGIGLVGELLVRQTVDPSRQYVIDRIVVSPDQDSA